ncbi:MAG: hypothetical protein WBL46_08780, partial [Nitrososphaeraceae archaeon]
SIPVFYHQLTRNIIKSGIDLYIVENLRVVWQPCLVIHILRIKWALPRGITPATAAYEEFQY